MRTCQAYHADTARLLRGHGRVRSSIVRVIRISRTAKTAWSAGPAWRRSFTLLLIASTRSMHDAADNGTDGNGRGRVRFARCMSPPVNLSGMLRAELEA